MKDEEASFPVRFLFQGQTSESDATAQTTAADLFHQLCDKLQLDQDSSGNIKMLYKGKRLNVTDDKTPVFPQKTKATPKIMVLVTAQADVAAMNAKRSDPTIRGFDQEQTKKKSDPAVDAFWGPQFATQNKDYKFCRFEACTWQSFGHRPVDSTPHAFAARALLERLATDPGIQAVMKTRQLVVGTLGEMDPVDDRLMHQTQQQGACLLGYNTNAGQRIDVKLRTDNLKGFRPYSEIAATLIHELSHNWVGEHNVLFWTNYAQMRCQYLYTHARRTSGYIVRGKTTAQLAEIPPNLHTAEEVYERVLKELSQEMLPHGLHPRTVAAGLWQHVLELEANAVVSATSQTTGLVPSAAQATNAGGTTGRQTARDLAWQAAERRAKEQNQQKGQKDPKDQKESEGKDDGNGQR